jgi:hypothetical protein
LKKDLDEGEILVLADRLVVVQVGYLPVLRRNAVFQFLAIERAIMIDIKVVERGACRRLRLREIDSSILVGSRRYNVIRIPPKMATGLPGPNDCGFVIDGPVMNSPGWTRPPAV